MKMLKYASLLLIICGLILGYNVIIYASKPEVITTSYALDLVSKKVPCEAKYEGYKRNQIDGITILYYDYNNASHIVKLSHPEANFTREIKWNEVLNIEYE